MDTYGHLFPGQAEAAVNKLHATMVGPSISLLATGTEAASAVTPEFAQRLAQRAGDETLPERASPCDEPDPVRAQTKPPKSRPVADLEDGLRQDATDDESGAARTRTWNQRIMSPVRNLRDLRMPRDSV